MSALYTLALSYILTYNYIAIFIITVFAAMIFPFPPGTLLMASAAFAAQGYLNFGWVLVAGILGNIIGDNLGYWLARTYGKKILYKLGLRKKMESEQYKKLEDKIKKSPGVLIFVTRFEAFANLSVNIISGLAKIPYRKYLLNEALGEILQVTLYCTIGYIVGNNWQEISSIISKILWLIIFITTFFIIIFWKKIKRFFS